METKLDAGAEVWAVERDEDGKACEVSGYMFLAEVAGFVIASSYINDMEHIEGILAYHAQETVENYDTDLAVFPAEDCWPTKETAHAALNSENKEDTLYNYIYRGDVFLFLTPEHLHDKGRRHYAAKSKKEAARAPRGQSIEKRPEEVKSRGSFGHWEMDSIMGCKGSKQALLVLTERRTRMGFVILVEDHTAASVVKAINGLERRFGKLFYKLFKIITVDNSCEFQDFEGIEMSHRRKGKRTVVFFCHPYSAYERGSNENMNRLIRRFFPKGTNFDEVTEEEVMAAERWVNNYPRKILGWKSAAMLFDQELQAA